METVSLDKCSLLIDGSCAIVSQSHHLNLIADSEELRAIYADRTIKAANAKFLSAEDSIQLRIDLEGSKLNAAS